MPITTLNPIRGQITAAHTRKSVSCCSLELRSDLPSLSLRALSSVSFNVHTRIHAKFMFFVPSTGEIVNKLAVVMVLIFKNEFPEVWPTFFTDLASTLLVPRPGQNGGPASADLDPVLVQMYLAILGEIDVEVVSNVVHRSNEALAHNRALVRIFHLFIILSIFCM